MATISQPYQVSLISNDLASGETLLDVFYSLDHLQSIVNEIFQRIDTRVEDERQRIQQIKHRVNTCVEKIQQIKGSNQAITVFSTAKYPAPKTLPSYPTLLGHTSNVGCIIILKICSVCKIYYLTGASLASRDKR